MATTTSSTRTGTNGSGTAGESDSSIFQSARDSVSGAARSAGQTLTGNPTAAVAGGFAVGALLGLALPVTRRERELLEPVGEKITEAARTAARNAAEAGRDKLNQVTGQVVTQVGSAVVDAVGGTGQ